MSDSASINPVRPPEPPGDVDRDARIEELLLSGLDHYFAGQYERAISVWTRIIFLDRHHDRARAYIERARSALAERQRECEELFHDGVAAYNAGHVDRARELLTRAVQQGSETADLFLTRLDRLDPAQAAARTNLVPHPVNAPPPRRHAPREPTRRGWLLAAVGATALGAVMLVGGLPIGAWLSALPSTPAGVVSRALADDPLPVLTPSAAALDRARALRAGGRLHEALTALDRVDPADPSSGAALELRAAIQRDLLAAAGLLAPPAGEGPRP